MNSEVLKINVENVRLITGSHLKKGPSDLVLFFHNSPKKSRKNKLFEFQCNVLIRLKFNLNETMYGHVFVIGKKSLKFAS